MRDSKLLSAAMTLYYLLLIGVILWSLSDEPVGPRVWYRVTRTLQAVARFFGQMGIVSERAYYESVERSRM